MLTLLRRTYPIPLLGFVAWDLGWSVWPGLIAGGLIYHFLLRPQQPQQRASTHSQQDDAVADFVQRHNSEVQQPVRTVAAILADLDHLTGLARVKSQIAEIVSTVQASHSRQAHGLPPIIQSLHCTFEGGPGTGKTTVARLMAELFTALAVFPGGRPVFVEATKPDLVGAFVGSTAPKVRAVCDRAAGGVLLIDEAYSLVPVGHGHDFAAEALAELIVCMEDNRHKFAVVLAGYPMEIDALVTSNPGLASRLAYRITFEDYSADELLQIVEQIMQRQQYHYDADVLTACRARIARHGDKLPGNARDVRSWVEAAIRRAAVARRADKLLAEDFSGGSG